MHKRPFLKLKPIRNRATNDSEKRVQRHLMVGRHTVSIIDRVDSFTQFCELGVSVLAYLLHMVTWSEITPVIAANLTDTQRRTMASAARTLALNLEINQELEKTK